MSPDLFRQIVEARPSAPASRLSALPVSIFVHALVLAALVVIPLLASDVLPMVRGTDYMTMPIVVAPRPPTIPTPAPARPVVADLSNPDAAPLESPTGISRERMIQTDPLLETTAPNRVGEVPGSGVPGGDPGANLDAPPPPRPTGPVRLSSTMKAPVKIHDVSPVYPSLAIASHVEGVVVIEAVIGPTGNIVDARVLRSKPLLDEAALAAVRQWRYTPTLLGGVPMSVILTVTVTFALK
jgi:periplasmic protein TonB